MNSCDRHNYYGGTITVISNEVIVGSVVCVTWVTMVSLGYHVSSTRHDFLCL